VGEPKEATLPNVECGVAAVREKNRQDARAVAERLARDRPKFHLADRDTSVANIGEQVVWNALPETLAFIADGVSPADLTLEIGSGASTVVFAAAGARHTAISPVSHEHERIVEYCNSIGVPTHDLSFVAASSDAVVPTLDQPLDLVLLDGTHAFPYAIVEWHYLRRLLRPGGLMVIDDVPIPAVTPLHRFMSTDESWEVVRSLDRRTVAFRKLRESPAQTWRDQRINDSYPDYSHLPPRERVAARTEYRLRLLRSRLGARLPARLKRPLGR